MDDFLNFYNTATICLLKVSRASNNSARSEILRPRNRLINRSIILVYLHAAVPASSTYSVSIGGFVRAQGKTPFNYRKT